MLPPTPSPLPTATFPVYPTATPALLAASEQLAGAENDLDREVYEAEEAQKLAGVTVGEAGGQSPSPGAVAHPHPTFPASTATPAPLLPQPTLTPIPPADMFFAEYGVNPFLDTEDEHLSTFAMDVDTASYTIARSYLTNVRQLPPPEAIRSEEFVNYFDAEYAGPVDEREAFAIHLAAAPAPFGFPDHYLFRVGLQGRVIPAEARDPAFLIFVIDVSGSMDTGNRLGLVKESLALLVDELTERDRVAIVVYSDNSRVVLDPTPASERRTILNAINALHPEGSTNVDAGLQLGYQLAEGYQRGNENTRVIVLSDGVANVDVVTPEGILANVQRGVERGITLSTIGFGMENYNDVLMEQLANDGNGNYYYVDTLRQARRIFVYDLTSTLQVIAYDAKVQVDFNPRVTDRFRQIGYENRALAAEDFRNNSVDAGEVGAGHNITALYEIALENRDLAPADVIATVYVRYQDAETRQVVELHRDLTVGELYDTIDEAPFTFRLQAAAAEFAELLKGSYWAQDGSYDNLLNFAIALERERPNHLQVVELVELIEMARGY